MGTLHGGILCNVADAAMGTAYRSTLAAGETFTTIELKINFLRPVWKAKLRAEERMVHAGRTLGLVECNIFDDSERLVAPIEHMREASRPARLRARASGTDQNANLARSPS
jgi:uncharacterized protein (TIGR00369 family)